MYKNLSFLKLSTYKTLKQCQLIIAEISNCILLQDTTEHKSCGAFLKDMLQN